MIKEIIKYLNIGKLYLNKVYAKNINYEVKGNTIDIDKISELDEQGNMLLFYLITEMNKLFSYNNNG